MIVIQGIRVKSSSGKNNLTGTVLKNPLGSKMRLQKFLSSSNDDIIELLRCIDHPKRFNILISMIDGKRKSFSEILEDFDIQKTALANHLSLLTEKGLLLKKEKGIYQISFEAVSLLENIALSFMQAKFREQKRLVSLLSMVGKTVEYVSEEELIMGIKNIEEIVKVVQLPPMKVVSFHATKSTTPEYEAREKLESWAKPKGLFDIPHKFQIYGFNNPNPTKEEPLYGYEFWITVPEDFEVDKDLTIKTHPGGLFGVMSCRGVQNITKSWNTLLETIQNSSYTALLDEKCFEHHVDPYVTDDNLLLLELYLPIAE